MVRCSLLLFFALLLAVLANGSLLKSLYERFEYERPRLFVPFNFKVNLTTNSTAPFGLYVYVLINSDTDQMRIVIE